MIENIAIFFCPVGFVLKISLYNFRLGTVAFLKTGYQSKEFQTNSAINCVVLCSSCYAVWVWVLTQLLCCAVYHNSDFGRKILPFHRPSSEQESIKISHSFPRLKKWPHTSQIVCYMRVRSMRGEPRIVILYYKILRFLLWHVHVSPSPLKHNRSGIVKRSKQPHSQE